MSGRKRRLPAAMLVGGGLLAVLVLMAVVAPMIWGKSAAELTSDIRQGHSSHHPLGTDSLGRDVLARTLVATRLTLEMSAVATLISAGIGMVLGSGIALLGRRIRYLGARGIDLLVSYPPIITALAITAIFLPGKVSVVLAIGIAFCPQYARLTNTLANSVSAKDFIIGARLLGVSRTRVLTRHVVPNIAAPILVLASVGFANSIVSLSGLSYLGLGVQQPAYDWGALLSNGLRDLFVNPAEALGPAIAILLTGLSAGLFGDGLARYLEPRPLAARRRSSKRTADGRPKTGTVPLARHARAGTSRGPAPDGDAPALVSVRDLRISRLDGQRSVPLVRGVSLDIAPGEIVGLVGESGSGKSLTAMATARLLPPALEWTAEKLTINDMELSHGPAPTRLATDVGIVFQDPSSCFNPALRLGTQLTEVLRTHRKVGRAAAKQQALDRLREVRISSPEVRYAQYPHELSGGMRQRAMIAMALLSEPRLLIADEPTTALDVTVQAEVLRLLRQINRDHGMAILLISHDINVISTLCHRICVMYAGRVVEEVSVEDLRAGRVQHPYTQALLAATPGADAGRDTDPLRPLPGRPPQPGDVDGACSFADRCPLVTDRCRNEEPILVAAGAGRVACHAVDLAAMGAR